jgi:hypothetical protein
MNEFEPDTFCGIYCGACSVAAYGRTGRADGFVACLTSVPREELACGGCKSEDLYAGCSAYSLRSCAREKNIEHCVDCADYPCAGYRKWQSLARFLPHTHESASSLEAIKREGAGRWLDAQRKRWLCPGCGAPFSWYAAACNECGRSLESETYTLSRWKRLLCRFVLSMAYRKGKAERKRLASRNGNGV